MLVVNGCGFSNAITINKTAIKGQYIFGHEVSSFKPCHQEKVYWLAGEETVVNQLQNDYQNLSLTTYQPAFLQAEGHFTHENLDGFALDYDGVFNIDKVLTLKEDITECRDI